VTNKPKNTDREEGKWDQITTLFRESSTQVSAIIRQFTLGGIAFAWVLKTKVDDTTWAIPAVVASAIIFFLVSLVLDIVQYLYTSYSLDKVLEAGQSADLTARETTPPHILFYLKIGFALGGLWMVLVFTLMHLTIQ
jgi:hypothetical protein